MLRYLGALTEVQCIVAALVLPKSKTNFGKGGQVEDSLRQVEDIKI